MCPHFDGSVLELHCQYVRQVALVLGHCACVAVNGPGVRACRDRAGVWTCQHLGLIEAHSSVLQEARVRPFH